MAGSAEEAGAGQTARAWPQLAACACQEQATASAAPAGWHTSKAWHPPGMHNAPRRRSDAAATWPQILPGLAQPAGLRCAAPTHQHGAALELDAIHCLAAQLHRLGVAVQEAAQAVPDAKDLVLGHAIIILYKGAGSRGLMRGMHGWRRVAGLGGLLACCVSGTRWSCCCGRQQRQGRRRPSRQARCDPAGQRLGPGEAPTSVYTMFCTTSLRPGQRPPPAEPVRRGGCVSTAHHYARCTRPCQGSQPCSVTNGSLLASALPSRSRSATEARHRRQHRPARGPNRAAPPAAAAHR